MNNFDSDSIVRWVVGFGAATPLAAQQMQTPGTPWWMFIMLPVLAALGNVIAGIVMEVLKSALHWWRAKVRHEIKELGENPDAPQITAQIGKIPTDEPNDTDEIEPVTRGHSTRD